MQCELLNNYSNWYGIGSNEHLRAGLTVIDNDYNKQS